MRLKLLIAFSFLGFLLTTQVLFAQEVTPEMTEVPASTSLTPTDTPTTEPYTVKFGDTLYSIARRFKLTVNQIATLNGITNPNTIYVGQTIQIPSAVATPTPTIATVVPSATATLVNTPIANAETSTYIVQRGDTLFRIALKYKTTVAELLKLNVINNQNIIYVGQSLLVPATETVTTVPTSEAIATISATAVPTVTPIVIAAVTLTPAPIANLALQKGIEIYITGQDIATLVTQVQQLGVKWVKITLNWRDVEIVKGTLNLAAFDTAINALNEADISVMLTLTSAPDWARPSATAFIIGLPISYGPPDNPIDFGVFAKQIAEHYKGKVQAYEIWSEPNLRRSWISAKATQREDVTLSNVSYVDLLREAYTNIKSVDPSIMVVTAGLAPTATDDIHNAIPDRVFLETILKNGALTISDAIGVEPDGFANPPDAKCCVASPDIATHYEQPQFYFLNTLKDYRVILMRNGGTDKPLWITRFGWGTAEGNGIVSPNLQENPYFTYTNSAEQAQYDQRAFTLAQELGYVEGMFLFNLNGCSVNNGEACFYSLIASGNTLRPVGQTLGLQPPTSDVPLQPIDPTPTPQG